MRPKDAETPRRLTPEEAATDYEEGKLVERAAKAGTNALPSVRAIVNAMFLLRCEGMAAFRASAGSDECYGAAEWDLGYGPPKLVVVDGYGDLLLTREWDHTPYSLEQMAEIAKSVGGFVTVEQDVYLLVYPMSEENWLHEGFGIEVWPRFCVRP